MSAIMHLQFGVVMIIFCALQCMGEVMLYLFFCHINVSVIILIIFIAVIVCSSFNHLFWCILMYYVQ